MGCLRTLNTKHCGDKSTKERQRMKDKFIMVQDWITREIAHKFSLACPPCRPFFSFFNPPLIHSSFRKHTLSKSLNLPIFPFVWRNFKWNLTRSWDCHAPILGIFLLFWMQRNSVRKMFSFQTWNYFFLANYHLISVTKWTFMTSPEITFSPLKVCSS